MSRIYSIITGTGSYIPQKRVLNEQFLSNEFFDANGEKLNKANEEIVEKFQEITTITERRYVSEELKTSDIAKLAAEEAIKSASIDKESLDYIILAHNFGDTRPDTLRADYVPCLAARVKQKLGIENPMTVAYDISFGCPGWIQAMIQADYYLRSGDAKRILVIGADVLSRISDPHDRDSMIYADGAGATIVEGKESDTPIGIIGHKARTDALHYADMLHMGVSYNPDFKDPNDLFLKMNGRKLYQYALENVPQAIKDCLDSCHTSLENISKILIHQANGKMDDAILKRLYKLYNLEIPKDIMPMTISSLGNSSVATLPTLFDLIQKEKLNNHSVQKNDKLIFASVGAGMNINALLYQL